ncbi:MAG TPA: glycosyltransferase family 4 protein [Bryobacteraceae bacterium]|nr:glycosyltransferase family 4 protein [Bryobacteraceae bacterium]
MRIVIATVQVPFVRGGAESHAQGLLNALCQAGHQVDIVTIPFKWYPAETILDHMLGSRLIDLSAADGHAVDLMVGLRFPAYLASHPRKILWILHQYRSAYDLWDHPLGDLHRAASGLQVKAAIRAADGQVLRESRAVFANSQNVARRLKEFCGFSCEPLYHPPPHDTKFYTAAPEDYLFFPSRINPTKRQHLVIEALAITRRPVRIKFCGGTSTPEYLASLKDLASKLRLKDRVEFCGEISEEQKRDLYARCRAVIFPPVDEDYGYITLEAMLSAKPVITCSDSGGTLEFVQHGITGLVAAPEPTSLADAIDQIWDNSKTGVQMGEAGRELYKGTRISWETVVRRLTACA